MLRLSSDAAGWSSGSSIPSEVRTYTGRVLSIIELWAGPRSGCRLVHMEVGTAVVICRALLRTVLSAKEMWDQRNGNTEVAEELTAFIRDLQVNEKTLDAKQLGTNNTSTWSMAALREDLEKANQGAQHILKKGFIEKLWNSNKIKEELRVLRERVMTSFQVKLLFTTLDVTLDNSKNQREFQAAMSRVQQELNRTHAETSAANLREIKNAIRRELKLMWQPVQTEMRAQGKSVEGAIGVIKGTGFQAQTDDTEKFFADVLMELENAMKDSLPASASTSGGGERPGGSSTKSKAGPELIKWYHDPITWDIMCDPVKASDRRTYDRWTLLNNSSSMKRSPFDRDQEQPLKVEFDDVDVRSRLFHKFPEQEERCKARRREYREEALRKALEGFVGDALVMLNHVLDWAGEDSECRAKRDEIAGLVTSRDRILDTGPGGALETLLAVDTGGGLESLLAVDTRFLDSTKVAISSDNLTLTTLMDAAVCFRTTSPCPPGSSFYFEMQVKDAGAKGRVAIGFSTGAAFKPDRLPGLYPASWAYLGYDDPLTATAGRVVKGREPLCPGDTVGAGLLHKSRHIYFIHNGALLGAVAVDAGTDLAQLFPTVGLARRDAKVTLNFGRGRDFMTQHVPTRLDRESCSTDALGAGFISISPQGTEAQFWGRDEVVAVRADSPAPCRFPSYYLELQVMQDAGPYGRMGIGFTDSHLLPFRSGRQKKSFAFYYGDGRKTGSGPSFTAGDTLGAGIFYGTDEFFFRKNGVLVGSFSRSSSTVVSEGGLLFPAVALHAPAGSPCARVRLNFGATPFVPEVLPSKLNFQVVPPYAYVPARAGPVLAAQADHSVPVGTDFYFELELGSGTLQQENWQVAIGFANLENFCSNKQPGVYAGSCGYHQDGGLYCGSRLQSEHACGGFGAGDKVGAGVLRRRNILFFTRNGRCVASVDYLSVFSQLQVYPTVGMTSLDEQALRIHFFDDVESMSSGIPEGMQSPTRSIPAPAPTRALARLPSRLLRSLSSPQISSTEAHSKRSPWSPGFLFFEPSKPAQNPYVIP